MHAVVDTNILVSALLRPASAPGAVMRAVADQMLVPVLCTDVIAEYTEVLHRRRFGFATVDVDETLTLIVQQAMWVEVLAYTGFPALPDPKDWPFIACALATGCPVVTGNARHFPLTTGVRAMTARAWVEDASARSRGRP